MPEKEAWFKNSEGVEFSCNEGSVAFDLMAKDGSFTRIDGSGGGDIEPQPEPEIQTEGVTYSEEDAIAQNGGVDANDKSGESDTSSESEQAKKPATKKPTAKKK